MRRHVYVRYVVPALLVGLLLVGCGPGGASAGHPGAAESNSLLQQVVSGISYKSTTVAASLGDPQPGYDVAPGSSWVYLTTDESDQDSGNWVFSQWQAALVASAYGALAAAPGDPGPNAGVTFQFGKAGENLTYYGSVSADGLTQFAPLGRLNENDAVTEINQGAKDLGLSVVSIDFEHPSGLAPVAVLQSDDAAAFVKLHPRAGNELLTPEERADFEGLFVEVLDESGSPFEADGYSVRSQRNITWIRRDLFDPSTMCGIGCQIGPETQF